MFTITIRSLWRTRGLCFAVAALLAVVSVLIGATGSLKVRLAQAESAQPGPAVEISEISAVQSPTPAPLPGPVEVVRFSIYHAGIYPRQVHARAGHLAIMFEDLSGDGSSGLALQPSQPSSGAAVPLLQHIPPLTLDGGTPLPALIPRVPGSNRARGDFVFGVGQFQVFDASHPTSRAVLIVDPPISTPPLP